MQKFSILQYRVPQVRSRVGHKVTRPTEVQPGFITVRNVLAGLWMSFVVHFVAIGLTLGRAEFESFEWWILTLVDTGLLALVLVPLIAVARRELVWYDPIAILSAIYLPMSNLFYLAFMLDPDYTFYRISSFGRMGMLIADTSDLLWATAQAEFLLFLFLLIVIYTNRHRVAYRSYVPSWNESWAAWITFLFCSILGAGGWLLYWGQRPYLEAATLGLGTASVKIIESGAARYVILYTLGLASFSLGLAGGYGFVLRNTNCVRTIPLILMMTVAVLADLPSGSRTGIYTNVLLLLYMAALLGYRIQRRVWVIGGLVGLGLLLMVTFVRGNYSLASDPIQVLRQVVEVEASTLYWANLDSPAAVLFSLDRVSATLVVLKHFEAGGEYLYGQTLVAGLVNLIGDLANRLGRTNPIAQNPILWSAEHILIWFFGWNWPGGTLPPSVPVEFYMQGGWFAFFLLSVLLALILRGLRERLANSNSLLGRWLLGVVLFRIVTVIPTEVSALATTFFVFIPPIILLYGLANSFSRRQRRVAW